MAKRAPKKPKRRVMHEGTPMNLMAARLKRMKKGDVAWQVSHERHSDAMVKALRESGVAHLAIPVEKGDGIRFRMVIYGDAERVRAANEVIDKTNLGALDDITFKRLKDVLNVKEKK